MGGDVVKTRFAPTPSGWLHVGNALSFIITWLYARSSANGTIHLRIDDIDGERARDEFIEDIFRGIEWLGLDYDTGPTSVDDFFKNHSQHTRLDLYNGYLRQLIDKGLLFACNCSRKRVHELPNMLYDGHCIPLHIPFETPETNWRIITPEGGSTVSFTDVWNTHPPVDLYTDIRHFIVRGKNGRAAYQMASVADDVLYNINFIVRGEDLLQSTAAQCYIAGLLPPLQSFTQSKFLLHPLIMGADGEKLSKSKGATALVDMRDAGKDAADVFALAASMLNLPKAATAKELLSMFQQVKLSP
jgi:glutamyl/glutaminyl-tRNA synthetase